MSDTQEGFVSEGARLRATDDPESLRVASSPTEGRRAGAP